MMAPYELSYPQSCEEAMEAYDRQALKEQLNQQALKEELNQQALKEELDRQALKERIEFERRIKELEQKLAEIEANNDRTILLTEPLDVAVTCYQPDSIEEPPDFSPSMTPPAALLYFQPEGLGPQEPLSLTLAIPRSASQELQQPHLSTSSFMPSSRTDTKLEVKKKIDKVLKKSSQQLLEDIKKLGPEIKDAFEQVKPLEEFDHRYNKWETRVEHWMKTFGRLDFNRNLMPGVKEFVEDRRRVAMWYRLKLTQKWSELELEQKTRKRREREEDEMMIQKAMEDVKKRQKRRAESQQLTARRPLSPAPAPQLLLPLLPSSKHIAPNPPSAGMSHYPYALQPSNILSPTAFPPPPPTHQQQQTHPIAGIIQSSSCYLNPPAFCAQPQQNQYFHANFPDYAAK
ncbi:hypothetical protein BJ508DRAFT_363741 [Ascobolus immersus RN42]|uniref:Uncharacterized protein n=1 Tax=Ascobolus immersus RN42 TaxID=1160509 RepID=A0A3N4HY00_ASCIM|nr:hypothetical protein BJ508DRAFT_363741 [Ascobolus immersus RN42]